VLSSGLLTVDTFTVMLTRILAVLAVIGSVVPGLHGLEWKSTSFQHEAGPLDKNATAVFSFTNTGRAPVTITDISASCGCTVPDLPKRLYAPGESGDLRVIFNFGGLVGRQSKTVRVTTDETADTSYVLTLQVDIPRLYDLDRHFVVWRRGDPATPQEIGIRVVEPGKVKLISAESLDERFTASIEGDGKDGRYRVVIKPQNTAAVMQGGVVVKTNFPPEEPRDITIYALVR
jgi:hypothetical protein